MIASAVVLVRLRFANNMGSANAKRGKASSPSDGCEIVNTTNQLVRVVPKLAPSKMK